MKSERQQSSAVPTSRIAGVCLVVGLVACADSAQQRADPQLSTYIDSIRAVDNHAHVFAPDVADDKGYDALRCESLPATPGLVPANLRFGPDTQTTWKALYGLVPTTGDEADRKMPQMHAALRKERGESYYDWVLDQSGVDIVLANRVAMPSGLNPPRFRWVSYADALIFPLNNAPLKAENPDRKALFTMEEELFRRYLQDARLAAIPATLAEYVDTVALATLRRQKAAGAVGIKFETAYLRALDFGPVSREAASSVYQRYASASAVPSADYKTLQDYLFHEIAAEAGRLGLAVHIHTGAGCGESFDVPGSDPMLLTRTFNDPTLRATTFVMLHGGSPFERHITSLILKPNVYVDTSVLEFMFSPQELARILRPWLESMPEHVLFGTDADFFSPGMAWVETTWLGSRKGRQALAIALTQMIRDDVIDQDRAKEIAQSVLRRNAWQLYRLDAK